MDNTDYNRLDGITKRYVDFKVGSGGIGATGSTGPSGTSGLSGTSGTSGTRGTSGSSGLSGLIYGRIANIATNRLINSVTGASLVTIPMTANRAEFTPWIWGKDVIVSALSIEVTTNVAGAGRIAVYSDFEGLPYIKLFESATFSTSTTGLKTNSITYTFNAGTIYWLCSVTDNGSSVRAIAQSYGFLGNGASNLITNKWSYTTTALNLPSPLTQSSIGTIAASGPVAWQFTIASAS